MNGRVAKPVGYIALCFSKDFEPRLTNRGMAGIALEYMERMSIRTCYRLGGEVHFKHMRRTDEVQGVVFTMNGYHFNGFKVDRCFSYSKIDAILQHNMDEDRIELITKGYWVNTSNVTSLPTL